MRRRGRRRPFLYVAMCLLGMVLVLAGAFLGTMLWHAQQQGVHAATVSRQRSVAQASVLTIRPMYKQAVKMGTNAQGCLHSAVPPLCYSPQLLRVAYGVQPLIANGITGKGRIITIIDAFQDPTIRSDLHLFDTLFGLNDPQLNIIAPFGLTRFNPKDPAQTGFAGEIALDVEWAHAIAPGATIDLVLANVKQESLQGELAALLRATGFAVQNDIGSVISQSFGASEECVGSGLIQQAHAIFQTARVQKQTVFASAGDSGAAAVRCAADGQPVALVRGVNYPASDPLVTSVGGTTLQIAADGTYVGETTWNGSQRGTGATGGGISNIFALPGYQQNIVNAGGRGVSDIALDADPLTGVPIVTSSMMPGETMIIPTGGTSVGAPVAAGMTALFDQAAGGRRLGFLNGAFYRISQQAAYTGAFHDVTTGNNTFTFKNGNGGRETIAGFEAGVGWDSPTGVGSPDAANLATLLPQFIIPGDGAGL
jgi:subtilase family serine protease